MERDAQQVCFSQRKFDVTADAPLSMDAWDGYRASRARVVAGAQATGVENWLILTGDVHVGYALDVKEDFDDPESATVGTEVTCTSVASGRDGVEQPANWDLYMRANPHMKFYNGKRGYVRVGLDREAARLDFRTVSAVTTPGAPVTTAASFVTEAGNPGLTPPETGPSPLPRTALGTHRVPIARKTPGPHMAAERSGKDCDFAARTVTHGHPPTPAVSHSPRRRHIAWSADMPRAAAAPPSRRSAPWS